MDFTEAYSDCCSTLGMAARIGSVDRMRDLLTQDRPADVADNRGWRPLHEAANSGSIECLKILLKLECTDVNWTSFDQLTPLHLAVKNGHLECVRVLIDSGADINIANDMNCTPVLTAVRTQNERCVHLLVESGADVNRQPHGGRSPLHQAAALGHVPILTYLLSHGARLDIAEAYGITPIFLAAQFGRYQCLKVLLEKAEEKGLNDLINEGATDGATPLFLAAQEGQTDCVSLLIQRRADANIGTTPSDVKAVPLHAAVEFDHIDCIKLLFPVTDPSSYGEINLFSLACQKSASRALQYLITTDMDVNQKIDLEKDLEFAPWRGFGIKFKTSVSPLTLIPLYKSGIVNAERLIAAGASVNECVRHSITPLLPAAHAYDKDMIKLLVANGANVTVYHPKAIPNIVILASLRVYQCLAEVLLLGADVTSCFYTKKQDNEQICSEKMKAYKDCEHCALEPNEPYPEYRVSFADILARNSYHWGSRGYFTLMNLLQFVGNVLLDKRLRPYVRTEKQWKCLQRLTEDPRQLSFLCRLKIRSAVGSSRLVAQNWVDDLLIPKTVKDFLLYKSLDDDITECGSLDLPDT